MWVATHTLLAPTGGELRSTTETAAEDQGRTTRRAGGRGIKDTDAGGVRPRGIGEIAAGAELYSRASARLFGGILDRGRRERVDRARLYPDPSAAVWLHGDGSRVG